VLHANGGPVWASAGRFPRDISTGGPDAPSRSHRENKTTTALLPDQSGHSQPRIPCSSITLIPALHHGAAGPFPY